jgi:hypothetical protein
MLLGDEMGTISEAQEAFLLAFASDVRSFVAATINERWKANNKVQLAEAAAAMKGGASARRPPKGIVGRPQSR